MPSYNFRERAMSSTTMIDERKLIISSWKNIYRTLFCASKNRRLRWFHTERWPITARAGQ
jgi:hypothetical protein